MEQAGFISPLSDEELKELGRLVVNCGFVEFLIGFHVSMTLGIGDRPSARIDLVNPLATRRKIEIVRSGLQLIPKPETRTLVEEGCKLADSSLRHRNTLLHGIWGFDSKEPDAKAVVVSTKERRGHCYPVEITTQADALAIASRKLKDALTVDGGGKPEEGPERLVIELA